MKILFFDMEFANGQVPGSIYSVGYLMTDSRFRTVVPQTDLLVNPECRWNWYVRKNILAYPLREVETAPSFPQIYKKIRKLFKKADVAVGFAVGNDVNALNKACDRYSLPRLSYSYFDVEKLCKSMPEHSDAHGLNGCVKAWCSEVPTEWHRSDVDAYATMLLFRAVCEAKHVPPEFLLQAYENCGGRVTAPCVKRSLWERLFGKKQKPAVAREQHGEGDGEQPNRKVPERKSAVRKPNPNGRKNVYVQQRAPKSAVKKNIRNTERKSV